MSLVELYEQGNSIEYVARIAKTNYSAMRKELLEKGVLRKRVELPSKVIDLYKGGYSLAKISELVCSNYSVVRRYLLKKGVVLRAKQHGSIAQLKNQDLLRIELKKNPRHSVPHTVEAKRKVSNTRKRLFVEGKLNIVNGMKGMKHSVETKRLMSSQKKGEKNGMYGRTHTPEVRARLAISSAKWKAKQKRSWTEIEAKVAVQLRNEGIPFEHEFRIGRYVYDFMVKGDILVECDGEYWHSLPGQAERDVRKSEFAEESGFSIFRIPGKDIMCSDFNIVEVIEHG